MIKFISDLHIGHENIIKYCKRPFSNINDMNEYIVYTWNKNVEESDTVFILGDLIFRYKENIEYYKKMKGDKIVLLGNHDKRYKDKIKRDFKVFDKYVVEINKDNLNSFNIFNKSVIDELEMIFKNNKINRLILSHRPEINIIKNTIKDIDDSDYILYGHIHNKVFEDNKNFINKYYNSLNCSIDVIIKPSNIEELILINKDYRTKINKLINKLKIYKNDDNDSNDNDSNDNDSNDNDSNDNDSNDNDNNDNDSNDNDNNDNDSNDNDNMIINSWI